MLFLPFSAVNLAVRASSLEQGEKDISFQAPKEFFLKEILVINESFKIMNGKTNLQGVHFVMTCQNSCCEHYV